MEEDQLLNFTGHLLNVFFHRCKSAVRLGEAELVILHEISSDDGGAAATTSLAETHTK